MPEHPIVHLEIPAQDPKTVSTFYASLFGWQVQPVPSMSYVRFQSADGTTGGFVPVGGPEGHRVGEVRVYFGSQDVEADLRRVEALGGKVIIPKTEIPNTGWFGIFEDPAGNRLGLFSRTGYVSS